MAANAAVSSTIPSRAKFKITEPSFMVASRSAFNKFLVESSKGTWKVTKSACLNNSSALSTSSTFDDNCHALLTVIVGSKPITRMPKASAALAI